MNFVYESVLVLGVPPLGQHKTIWNKQLIVETGGKMVRSKWQECFGWKRRSYPEIGNLSQRIRVENSHAFLLDCAIYQPHSFPPFLEENTELT